MISCGDFESNGTYSITWSPVSGTTYLVYRSTGANVDSSFVQQATAGGSYTASLANPSTTYWRVKAMHGLVVSGWSNTLKLVRNGNGRGSITCESVTP